MKHMEAFRKGNSQREFHQSFRSQSAMEYLMTYGWAILIIAVVLAALFELGVFNPMTFAPKASPGSCQVVRPEGPGTTAFISLAGECNGEIPQYVASFNGGSSTEINVDSMVVSNTAIAFTVSLWIYVPPSAPDSSMLIVGETSNSIADGVWGLSFDNYPDLYFGYECDGNDGATTAVKQGTWYYVVGVYKSGHGATYIDGINETSGSFGLDTNPGALSTSLTIGNGATCSYAPPNPFIGYASNLQIYNTPLSANDIKALYDEGIGGAPIKIQNLVGWWPLNGNANDYSGNGNNGVPTNVIYTSNWYSGYSAP